jgi:hypothetical protein
MARLAQMKHADQLAGPLGNIGAMTGRVTLSKSIGGSVAMELRNAIGLIMRCDKLVENLAGQSCGRGGLPWINPAAD